MCSLVTSYPTSCARWGCRKLAAFAVEHQDTAEPVSEVCVLSTYPAPSLQGEGGSSAAMRAFHPDEVRGQEHLSVDTRYYLQHQLHAVVSRLCEPIAGLDAAQVAECLGEWGGWRRWEEGKEVGEKQVRVSWCLPLWPEVRVFTFPLQSLGHTPSDNCCCQLEFYLPLEASIEVPHHITCLWSGSCSVSNSGVVSPGLTSYRLGQAIPLDVAKIKAPLVTCI